MATIETAPPADSTALLRKAGATDEARRNAAIALWVSEAANGYPVARPVSADEFKAALQGAAA